MSPGGANPFRVEALSERHERSGFCCGIEALDRYLRQQAGQDLRRRVTAPFVLVQSCEPEAIIGFYTLASTAIDAEKLPQELGRNLPRYPLIPAALLGRLAIDERHRGQGLGEFLLMDALKRCLETSRQVASFAVVVDAKDEAATAFYRRYGFLAFVNEARKLFLPMRTVAQLFA